MNDQKKYNAPAEKHGDTQYTYRSRDIHGDDDAPSDQEETVEKKDIIPIGIPDGWIFPNYER